jgi:hypothetical protein
MSNLWSSQQQPGLNTPAHTTSSFNPGTPMPNPFNRQQPTQGQTTLTSWVNPPTIQNPQNNNQYQLSNHQSHQNFSTNPNPNTNTTQVNGSVTFGRQSTQPNILTTNNYTPSKIFPPKKIPLR